MHKRKIIGTFSTQLFVFFLFFILLSGCAFTKKETVVRMTPEALYQNGIEDYQKADYREAIENFQKLKDEYPLSQLAVMAELGIADSHFSEEKYIEAEAAYTDFLNLHPANNNLPYIIYQLGLCHYKQVQSIDRDQSETVKARKEFEKLLSLYADSKYAFTAERLLKDCRRRLAEHEFYVGRFYFKSKKYKAALKRFEIVAREYPNIGLDYKVSYFITETKKKIDIAEKKDLKEAPKNEPGGKSSKGA